MFRPAVLFGILVAATPAVAAPADRPNIIFILADDLGYGGLSCYGQQKVPTPNLDRLAADGLRFTDCYAGSTVCAPSRCCLMTGLHTGHAWVRGNALVPLRPTDVTVAGVLKQAGYATGLVGKWGLGEEDSTGIPNRQGFDYFFGFLNQRHAHNYYPTFLYRNQERVPLPGNENDRRTQYAHDLFTQEALGFIEKNKAGPFFLYLAYTIPHANNELKAKTGNGMEVPDYGPYASRDWTDPQKGHAAMIDRMDRDIGRIMARLADLGLDKNTVVFFTSDNGPQKEGGYDPEFFDCSGPLRGIKRDLYEGGIRVPMIVRWPGRVKPGTESGEPWAFWDVLPTLAEIAGAKPPTGIDGISMLPALLGKEQKSHEYLYWEFHERGFDQAVRMGNWKGVRRNGGQVELYDLKSDIGEQHDVAADYPEVLSKIESIMQSARTDNEHWPVKRPAKPQS
ncbi:MAG: arylsulfatase [Planctomycetes bacterium]|nr:arylsulfatase [Planctomycetota bacterium]